MRLADDPSASPKALERVLEKDTGLTAKLLRVANSSYYGGNQVPSVGRAISILGLNTVKSLVLALSMQSISTGKSTIRSFDKVAYWQHSLASATAARILGKLLMPMRAEELYSAAMMHDIGLIVMEKFIPDELEKAFTLANNERIKLHEAERESLGFDHAEVGGLLAEKWGLSEHLHHAIRYHHSVEDDPMNYETTHIVSASNTLAHQCGFSTFPLPPGYTPELDQLVLSTVDLPDEQLEVIRSVLSQEVRRAQDNLMIKAA
jgi:HD-like signal output (HDOD) protein